MIQVTTHNGYVYTWSLHAWAMSKANLVFHDLDLIVIFSRLALQPPSKNSSVVSIEMVLDQLCDLSLFQVTVWFLEWTPHDPWQVNKKYIWSSCWQVCCLACPCPHSPSGCALRLLQRTSTTTSPYWPWVSTSHAKSRYIFLLHSSDDI